MSKRPYDEPSSPSREEPPLLPLRPPSVEGYHDTLQFGSALVDGVPISLPVPRLFPDAPEQVAKSRHSIHHLHAASPTAVTAAPCGSDAVSTSLGVIAEGEESGSEDGREVTPFEPNEQNGPTPETSNVAGEEEEVESLAHPHVSRRHRSALDHLSTGVDSDSSDPARPASLKRRKAVTDSPEPALRKSSHTVGNKYVDGVLVEGEGVDSPRSDGSDGGDDKQHSGGFKLELSVELPDVGSDRVPFGSRELQDECGSPSTSASDVPLYPLRPPSVSGCPELLRFGEETASLPVPQSASPDRKRSADE